MDLNLLQQAESGNVQAMLELSRFYALDENEKDLTKSTEWADKAAEAGSPLGYYFSMVSHSTGAITAEVLGFWGLAIDEWNMCAGRAKSLLDAHRNNKITLNEDQLQTSLNNLEEAIYGLAIAEYSQHTENTDVSRKVLDRLAGADSTRYKALQARCYIDLHDFQKAFPLLCEVIGDQDYVSAHKRLPEQAVFASIMSDLAIFYRLGMAGIVRQNIDQAYNTLSFAITGVEDDDLKALIQEELNHYQKKQFGGYTYVEDGNTEFRQIPVTEDKGQPSFKWETKQNTSSNSSHASSSSRPNMNPTSKPNRIPLIVGSLVIIVAIFALLSTTGKKPSPVSENPSAPASINSDTMYVEVEDESTANERNAQVSSVSSEIDRMISQLNQGYQQASFSLDEVLAPIDVEKASPGYVLSFSGNVTSGQIYVDGWVENDNWNTERINIFVNESGTSDAAAVANLYSCVLSEYYGVNKYDAEEEVRESLLYTDWNNTDLRFDDVNLWMGLYPSGGWQATVHRVSGSTNVTASNTNSNDNSAIWSISRAMCDRIDSTFGTPISKLVSVEDYSDDTNGKTIWIEFPAIANGYCYVGGHMTDDNSSFEVEYIEACTDIEYEEPHFVFEAILRGVYGVDDDDLSRELYHGCEYCQYPDNDGTWDIYVTEDISGRIFLDLGMIWMQVS